MSDIQSPFEFNRQMLDCVVGGVSALDIPRLNIENRDQARSFINAYGYDILDPVQAELLWSIYRRSVSLIREQLLDPGEVIPPTLADSAKLVDLSELLIQASSQKPEDRELQRWACAILRVMHVFVHLRNDLFSAFRDEIQTQILSPLQSALAEDEAGTMILGPSADDGGTRLHKFEIKPFKTTASSVIKLLARPERVALTLLDKLGVRFVTRNAFDSFRVIRFLFENHILSYPHIIPDQSNNTLYPVNLFMEVMEELKSRKPVSSAGQLQGKVDGKVEDQLAKEIQKLLKMRLDGEPSRAQYRLKSNEFSDPDYRFIKFINRKLVTVTIGASDSQRAFKFFYPYEIQVMDQDTFIRNLSGPMAHDEYKNRQRRKARDRVLRETPEHA